MWKKFLTIILVSLLPQTASNAMADNSQAKAVSELANTVLVNHGEDPMIVASVHSENKKQKTLSRIKVLDKEWRATPGVSKLMLAMMASDCARRLKALKKANQYFTEIFVTDNQGANVCMSDKTSDYWQGDEAKFQKSYLNGVGGVHISEIEFDESTQVYLVQVSVPVRDANSVIGTITFGIDVEELD